MPCTISARRRPRHVQKHTIIVHGKSAGGQKWYMAERPMGKSAKSPMTRSRLGNSNVIGADLRRAKPCRNVGQTSLRLPQAHMRGPREHAQSIVQAMRGSYYCGPQLITAPQMPRSAPLPSNTAGGRGGGSVPSGRAPARVDLCGAPSAVADRAVPNGRRNLQLFRGCE